MRRVYLKTIAILVGGVAAWALWQKTRDVSVDWPPRDPEPDPRREPADEPEAEVVIETEAEIAIEIDGVHFASPGPTLDFANTADTEALTAAGITGSGQRTLLAARPFPSLEALAGTRGIGPKTLAALARVAEA